MYLIFAIVTIRYICMATRRLIKCTRYPVFNLIFTIDKTRNIYTWPRIVPNAPYFHDQTGKSSLERPWPVETTL